MIKCVDRCPNEINPNVMVLFADTKDEVDEAESIVVKVNGIDRTPEAGSVCYTQALDVGVLCTDVTWDWGDDE